MKTDLIEQAKSYIEQHYKEKFILEELSSALFINKCYLSRLFRRETGSTLLQYHNAVRCEHAKELLSETDTPIDTIAWKVGYRSTSHFSRRFRMTAGCSPSEYRSRHRK